MLYPCKKFRSINLSSRAGGRIFRCILSCKSTCINSRNFNILNLFHTRIRQKNLASAETNLLRSEIKGCNHCNQGCAEITSDNIRPQQTSFIKNSHIFCFRLTACPFITKNCPISYLIKNCAFYKKNKK